jgi:hypothetical protein
LVVRLIDIAIKLYLDSRRLFNWLSLGQLGLDSDDWPNWRVVLEEWVLGDLLQFYSLCGVCLEELRYEVFCDV